MGALPRLKRKDELRYRKGSTNESANCQYCTSIVPEHKIIGIGGQVIAVEPRCKVMGMAEGRRYRVRLDYTCDAQTFDESKAWWMKKGARCNENSDDHQAQA